MAFIDALEAEIIRQVSLLKPELKAKFVVRVVDNGNEKNMAEVAHFNPPVMTFNLNNFLRVFEKNIRLVINHEVIHCLQYLKEEPEAYELEKRMDFFTLDLEADLTQQKLTPPVAPVIPDPGKAKKDKNADKK